MVNWHWAIAKILKGLSTERKGAICRYWNSCLHGSQGKGITWWWQCFYHSCFFSLFPFCRKNYVTRYWFNWAWFILGQMVEGWAPNFAVHFWRKERKIIILSLLKSEKSRKVISPPSFEHIFIPLIGIWVCIQSHWTT